MITYSKKAPDFVMEFIVQYTYKRIDFVDWIAEQGGVLAVHLGHNTITFVNPEDETMFRLKHGVTDE